MSDIKRYKAEFAKHMRQKLGIPDNQPLSEPIPTDLYGEQYEIMPIYPARHTLQVSSPVLNPLGAAIRSTSK
jgi:hypothetical protein